MRLFFRAGLAGLAAAFLTCAVARAADAPSFTPRAGESADAFARRAADAPAGDDADAHITRANWNGRPFIFVDYLVTTKDPAAPPGNDTEQDRMVVALARMPDGSYRRIDVTDGEEEGGSAKVEAIAFANADHDPAEELVVLLSWPVQHAIVEGTLYEVRIFDNVGAAPPAELTYLKDASKHFDKDTCDCSRSDAKDEHYPFKTMAAIKRELKKLYP